MRYLLWLYGFQTINTMINPISIPASPDLGGLFFALMALCSFGVIQVYRAFLKYKTAF